MEQRKYSLTEIDQMRACISHLITPSSYMCSSGQDPYPEMVESQLRTHMMNGTDPEELLAAVRAKNESERAWREQEKRRQA